MFWTIFLAVLAALLTMWAIDNISRSHRRWKAFCEAQTEEHNRLVQKYSDKGDRKMAEMQPEFYRDWKKAAKRWWGMR